MPDEAASDEDYEEHIHEEINSDIKDCIIVDAR